MSSPTRFSAKQRNARHKDKQGHAKKPVKKAISTCSEDSGQAENVTAKVTSRVRTLVEGTESAQNHKIQSVKLYKDSIKKEKVKKDDCPSREKRNIEKQVRIQHDPEPEQRVSRPVTPVRKRFELLSAVVIVVVALFALVFATRPRTQTLTFGDNQVTYSGTTVQGKMSGEGTMTFDNGDTYKGGFLDGYFDGQGTYTSQDGWKYEGQFVKGKADGQGTLTTQDNIVYEGTFKQGIYQSEN